MWQVRGGSERGLCVSVDCVTEWRVVSVGHINVACVSVYDVWSVYGAYVCDLHQCAMCDMGIVWCLC